MFRTTTKLKLPLVISSSSSSDDDKTDDIVPVLCSTYDKDGGFSILSSSQCDYPIRFCSGSFEFHYENDEIMFIFHPMFLWRYIHIQKMTSQIAVQTDYNKIISVASYHMKDPIQISICKTIIRSGQRTVEYDNYHLVMGTFNHLYRTLIRGYDAAQFLTEMLDICFKAYLRIEHRYFVSS